MADQTCLAVSVPLRGFWYSDSGVLTAGSKGCQGLSPLTRNLVLRRISEILVAKENKSQSLYGEFGTLTFEVEIMCEKAYRSQSPSGDFGNVTTADYHHYGQFILSLSPLTGNLVL